MKRKYIIGLTSVTLVTLLTSGQLHSFAYSDTTQAGTSPTSQESSLSLESKVVSALPGYTSTELQNLLDYNKEGRYKLTVYIPAGSYVLTKELRIYSNTTIMAEEDAHLFKNHQKGAFLANDVSKDQGGYTTSENITVSGGIWDSALIADKKKGTESFRFIHATNVKIQGAEICNVPGNSHLITFAGIKDGLIENCTLHGYVGTAPKEAIQLDIVHDNVVVPSNQSQYIKYDDLACDNILIQGNEIYDYPRAIGSHTSVKGVFHQNITITGNTLHDLTEAGIKAYNYKNLDISNNKIYKAGVGILAYTYISNEQNHYLAALSTTVTEPLPEDYNIRIADNTIWDIKKSTSTAVTSWGDGIRVIGNYQRPLAGLTITDNIIKSTARYAVFLEKAPSSTITGNTISNTADSGIYLINGSDNSTIDKNTLESQGKAGGNAGGIGLLGTSNTVISNNSITSAAKNGIYLYNNSSSCTISGNLIYTSGGNAIAMYSNSDKTKINGNFISDYSVNGIFAYGTNSAEISQNEIYGEVKGTVKDGIHIQGVNDLENAFTLINNYVTSTRRYGIYINARNSLLETNTVTKAMKYSIYLDANSGGSKLLNNSIDNSIWQTAN